MRKSQVEKQVEGLEQSLSKLTVDEINQTPVVEPEPQTKLTNKEKAAELGVMYIEPKRKLQAFGTLPEQQKKEHAHDWEYVKGIYENIESIGEPAVFWFSLYPGDPDCLWEIPSNVPVYVPRMIANHLASIQKHHIFDYKPKGQVEFEHGDFMHEFCVKETKYRGKFRSIEAF